MVALDSAQESIGTTLRDLLIAAFALVAALAWNDFARSVVTRFVSHNSNAIAANFVYAITISLVVVMIVWSCRAIHSVGGSLGKRAEKWVNGITRRGGGDDDDTDSIAGEEDGNDDDEKKEEREEENTHASRRRRPQHRRNRPMSFWRKASSIAGASMP